MFFCANVDEEFGEGLQSKGHDDIFSFDVKDEDLKEGKEGK